MRAVLTFGFLLLATMAMAQTVDYDFDRTTDFSKIKTYAWVQGLEDRDDLNAQRIMAAVDHQLALKGLTKVEPEAKPEVVVDYKTTFSKTVQANGWGTFSLAGNRSERAGSITVGTLNVLIRDANTRAVLWTGMATGHVDEGRSQEKRDKQISKVAEKMFKNYPPNK